MTKPVSYYQYETPKITVLWKGVPQPMRMYKTAADALAAINKIGHPSPYFALRTPEGDIDVKDLT